MSLLKEEKMFCSVEIDFEAQNGPVLRRTEARRITKVGTSRPGNLCIDSMAAPKNGSVHVSM
jgi:hypothetical protein